MTKIIILLASILFVVGCANKSKGNLSDYQDAIEDIQTYAEQNIRADWFAFLEPVGAIVVNGAEIKKAQVIDETERTAELTVLLKGYYSPMASTDEKERKQFKITKKFKVTKTNYGGESHYDVAIVGQNTGGPSDN